jgi:hypothetical protein
MIDHPRKTADLLAKLQAALPVPAIVTQYLARTLRKGSPAAEIPRECQVVWVANAGDAGGIVCKLAIGGRSPIDPIVATSITHLEFGYRHPLSRDIRTYQQRRIKKLRRQNG